MNGLHVIKNIPLKLLQPIPQPVHNILNNEALIIFNLYAVLNVSYVGKKE
jgi:hypothetical protein